MKQYYQIKEIADLYGVSSDTIRFYEKEDLIHPQRSENGYRYFTVNDMWRLNVIRDLRALGFPIDQIKQYFAHHSLENTVDFLNRELAAVDNKLTELSAIRMNILNRLDNLQQISEMSIGEVELYRFDQRRIFQLNEGYAVDDEMDILIKKLLNIDKEHHFVIGNNRIGSIMHLQSVYEKRYRDYFAVFIIDEQGTDVIPPGLFLTVSYKGSCEQNAYYLPKLLEYAKAHHLRPYGDIYEMLLIDIHEATDMSEYITQLQVPVKEY